MILEKDIFEKYRPTKDKCRPTVNPDVAEIEDRDNLEIACMIFNYKNIFWSQWAEVIQELDPDLKILIEENNIEKINFSRYYLSKKIQQNGQIIMAPAFIEEKQAILYTQKGKRNAFLLLKWKQELNLEEFENPGSWAESNNPFLIGTLLEYDKSDIKFYYRIAGFRDYLKHVLNKSDDITIEIHFVHWPEELKTEFYYYNNYFFKESEIYKLYKIDKKETKQWLEANKQYSTGQLQQQTKKMLDQISKKIKAKQK